MGISWILLLLAASVAMTTVVTGTCTRHSFLTFNVGLTPLVAEYDARARSIPKALANMDADVMCLQEVWYEHDMAAIMKATRARYPHSYSSLHVAVGSLRRDYNSWSYRFFGQKRNTQDKACSSWSVTQVSICIIFYCRSASDMLTCMSTHCPRTVQKLEQSCRTCLVMSSVRTTSDVRRCDSFWSDYKRFNPSGLLLLSKAPMASTEVNYFVSQSIPTALPRGYIQASVGGVAEIVCTHLSTRAEKYFEWALPYGSWEAQQSAEIEILKKTSFTAKQVLMGDLNTGPNDPARNLTGEFAANYAKLLAAGFSSPYDADGGLCTYCALSNPLLVGKNESNYLIDHVMSKHFKSPTSERVLGSLEGVTLSDHFGVKVEACL